MTIVVYLSNTVKVNVRHAFPVLQFHTLILNFILGLQILQLFTSCNIYLRLNTVLPAKSDSDVMFCLQVIRGLESIDHLCINPILWIGLIDK